jgi:hypothetical protein
MRQTIKSITKLLRSVRARHERQSIFIVLDKTTAQPLRMRERSAKTDPVACFDAREVAHEWMNEHNVKLDEFEIKEINENHKEVVARMAGIPTSDVHFTMLRPKSFK